MFEYLTESIVSRFQPEDLEVLCQTRPDGGSGHPLISCFSCWFASLGLHSGQLKNEPSGGLLESEISRLSDMEKRLTRQEINLKNFPVMNPTIGTVTLYI